MPRRGTDDFLTMSIFQWVQDSLGHRIKSSDMESTQLTYGCLHVTFKVAKVGIIKTDLFMAAIAVLLKLSVMFCSRVREENSYKKPSARTRNRAILSHLFTCTLRSITNGRRTQTVSIIAAESGSM